uniref:Ycf80 n=1 Tax=Gracilariopsis longissima TaxID=172976 RepID=A0A345U9G2_9FLOR|nr:hypothetical protein [Gracilariopsis longissima]AXI97098.1 hypothetical protein [Gracilariopsis longissima]UAD89014.1 hypothetical protein [Gracilariopsis longissima]
MHYIPLCSLPVIHNIFSSYHDSSTLNNRTLISRRFLGKLINQYWQETIFLSISNSSSEEYINQLKLQGVLICKNEQKKFLLDFSKALLAGRIETTLDFNKTSQNFDKSIAYVWKKGLNFSLPNKFWSLFINNKNNKLNTEQLILLKALQNQPLPLFTITNNLNQIILAKSLEETNYNLNLIDKIYKWYYHKFIFNEQIPAIYHGLFFMHPVDAIEYLNYIKDNYNISNKESQLKLFSIQLGTYYKLTRMNMRSLEFRLIPDLNEISKLLYQYRNYKNLKFDKNQKYGKNFFQGQPIYTIEPFWAFNKNTHKKELLKYNYRSNFNINNKNNQNKVIFTNYETVLKAWQKFSQESIIYKIPQKPQILVSNLENFIKQYEYSKTINKHNILFIPTIHSYKFIKQDVNIKPRNKINQIFRNKFFYFKILTQRIIWSLTSRQPINW